MVVWVQIASAASSSVTDGAGLSAALADPDLAPGDVITLGVGEFEGPFDVPAGVELVGSGPNTVLTASEGTVLTLAAGPASTTLRALAVDGGGVARCVATDADADLANVWLFGGAADAGGALWIGSGVAVDVVDSALFGSAVYTDGGLVWAGPGSDVRLVRVALTGGAAASRGGGLYAEDATVELRDTTVATSRAGSAGGGLFLAGSALRTIRVELASNAIGEVPAQEGEGGGAALEGGSWVAEATTARGNTAYDGGGVWLSGASAELRDLHLDGNRAARGGGLYATEPSAFSIRAATVADNRAVQGAGLYLTTGSATALLRHVAFCGNTLDEPTYQDYRDVEAPVGGAVWVGDTAVTVENSLVVGQSGGTDAGLAASGTTTLRVRNSVFAWNGTDGPAAVTTDDAATLELTSSLFAFHAASPTVYAAGTAAVTWSRFWLDAAPTSPAELLDPTSRDDEDPLLASAVTPRSCALEDWLPAPGSPLVDGGDPATPDPDGSPGDIGLTGGEHGLGAVAPPPADPAPLRRACSCEPAGGASALGVGPLLLGPLLLRARWRRGRPARGHRRTA
jgi:hypothetical protein